MSAAFVAALNRAVGAVMESLLFPLDSLSPVVGVAAVSVLVAIGMLIAFKATSDQKRIAATKRLMQAGLFEMRLFSGEPRIILQAQGDVLRATVIYLRLSAVPLLWMVLPIALITAHLQAHYGYQGLTPGSSALVKVRMRAGSEDLARSLTVEVPSGLRVETPMVWAPVLREASWRIAADRDGNYVLNVLLHGTSFTKTVLVSTRAGQRSPIRQPAGIVNQLLYPSEPPLPVEASISSIAVTYAEASVTVAGQEISWLSVFVIVSLAAALLFRRHLRVTF